MSSSTNIHSPNKNEQRSHISFIKRYVTETDIKIIKLAAIMLFSFVMLYLSSLIFLKRRFFIVIIKTLPSYTINLFQKIVNKVIEEANKVLAIVTIKI